MRGREVWSWPRRVLRNVSRVWWSTTYAVKQPPSDLAVLGAMKPLRRLGGQAAAELAAETLEKMPPGYVDVWLHAQAAERRESGVLHEAGRPELDASAFAHPRLDHHASWGLALLDPAGPDEEPDYDEDDARAVALSALDSEGLPQQLVGEHLLFCRYTCGATRRQPVWLAMFEQDGEQHLLIINSDTDRLLRPTDPAG